MPTFYAKSCANETKRDWTSLFQLSFSYTEAILGANSKCSQTSERTQKVTGKNFKQWVIYSCGRYQSTPSWYDLLMFAVIIMVICLAFNLVACCLDSNWTALLLSKQANCMPATHLHSCATVHSDFFSVPGNDVNSQSHTYLSNVLPKDYIWMTHQHGLNFSSMNHSSVPKSG